MIVYLYLCRARCQSIVLHSTLSLAASASPHQGLTVMPHLWAGPPGVRQLITANSSPPAKKYRKIQVSPKSVLQSSQNKNPYSNPRDLCHCKWNGPS